MSISILLSTYNGELFLKEQIESILNQKENKFKIIARDDLSNDNSINILNNYSIELVQAKENIGANQNFHKLLQYAKEDLNTQYFFFCDQDDIWQENKIEKAIKTIQELEDKQPNSPILVHSDLEVVDTSLNTINPSFWNYENLDPKKNSFNRLLLQNTITGCSVVVNRKLVELALDIPKDTIMHDWWLGLVASKFGHIGIIDEPLIKYRQHEKNEIGASNYSLKNIILKAINILFDPKKSFSIEKNILQAQEFLSKFENKLSSKDKEMLEAFINIKDKNKLQRVHTLIKYKIYKQGFLRNLGLFLTI